MLSIKKNTRLTLSLVHLGLGVLLLSGLFSKLFSISIAAFGVLLIIRSKNARNEAMYWGAYMVGAEVVFRMSGGMIFYELPKYSTLLFLGLGLVVESKKHHISISYLIYILLLLIGIAFVDIPFNEPIRKAIAFNLSGPILLGVSAIYFYKRKLYLSEILNMMFMMLLPIISMLVLMYFRTPDLQEISFSSGSNFEASGGFGPNQVATSLGLGMFIMVVRLFLSSPSLVLKYLNMIIFVAMTFRAFVTFSRGGVVAAVIVAGVFLCALFFKSSYKQKNQIINSLFLFAFAAAISWVISSNQTMGLLDKRYANEDAQGREKQDIATGRVDIFVDELEGFLRRPFLGVGASRTKDIRVEEGIGHLPSHNEIGRLLGEHGLFGIFVLTILIFKPLGFRSANKKNIFFYAFLAFWFATINHTGMRIAAPSFIYALALLNVSYEKRSIHRKQINK